MTGMSPRPAAAVALLAGILTTPGLGRAQRPDSLSPASEPSAQTSAPLAGTVDSLASLRPLAGLGAEAAQDSVEAARPLAGNPFAGFETHYLENGLKVWFKRLPGAPNASVSVSIPFGSHWDPRGKEGLAHFTEHMLFSDHDGQTEQQVKDAIEGLGGRRNGYTASDRTWYYATIDKQYGLFAIEWLSGIVSPHAMTPEVVERNRQPIALETNARPREIFEHAWAFLNPSLLLPPDFWQQEYGMDTRGRRRVDRWSTLQAIAPEDLRGFYDTYYVPASMTLTVVGDLDRDEALATAERSFGRLPRRPVPSREISIQDPNRRRATYAWGFPSSVRYTARYKFYHAGAEDELMILFLRDLLTRRLNQRLRYGERKAVYSLQVAYSKRGPAGFLQVRGSIDEGEYDFATGVIEQEIEALRAGTLDPAAFEADRTAVIERLRSGNQTSEALNFWVYRNFYDPGAFSDFPDVLGFYESVRQEEVASFASRNLVPERQVLSVLRIHPISQTVLAAAVLILAWLAVRIVGWGLTNPVTMSDIRYVARFRMPIVFRIVSVLAVAGVGLVLARITLFGLQWVTLAYVATVDDFVVQSAGYALMLVSLLALLLVYLSRFPRKLLVFPDHLRVKALVYRSRILKPGDLEEISLRRFHRAWLSRDLFRSFPMTLGLLRPGIYLRPSKGRAYFFRTRDTKELVDVLGAWRGAPLTEVGSERDEAEPPAEISRSPDAARQPTKSQAPPEALPPAVAGPTPTEESHDDIDFDGVGLTDDEMEELLGETRRDEDP